MGLGCNKSSFYNPVAPFHEVTFLDFLKSFHFSFSSKAIIPSKSALRSSIADHVKTNGHNIKWDHFDILAKGKTDYQCKIKEALFIQELNPAFNANFVSEKLMLN